MTRRTPLTSLCLAVLWLILSTPNSFALDLPPVDPDSDTDNTVNNFILNEVQLGYPQTIGGGGWWGPTDRFATNQLWAITQSQSGIFNHSDPLKGRVGCLRPGGGNGLGTAQNTLRVYNLRFKHAIVRDVIYPFANGEMLTLANHGYDDVLPGQTSPIRTQCFSREEVADIFGPGNPTVKHILRTGIKIPWWYQYEKPILDHGPAGFNVMKSLVRSGTLRSVPIAAQAWYQQTGYHYSVLDSAIDANGQLIPAANVAGSTLTGTVQFHWYALRGAREEGHGMSDFQTDIHHVELRVEESGEDYTYFKQMAPIAGQPIAAKNYLELTTDLDTHVLTDGWHIISFHSHIIDHGTIGPGHEMQLAAELKIPVCIANGNGNACTIGGEPSPMPLPTPTPLSTPITGTVTPPPTPTPTPTVPVVVPVSPDPANLLTNGDFLGGMDGWQWHAIDGSQPITDGNTILLPASLDYEAQLYQQPVSVTDQQSYLLRITAHGLVDRSELGVYLHGHHEPFTPFGLRATIPLSATWSTTELRFTVTNREDSLQPARLRLRPISGTIQIDAVHLLLVDSSAAGADSSIQERMFNAQAKRFEPSTPTLASTQSSSQGQAGSTTPSQSNDTDDLIASQAAAAAVAPESTPAHSIFLPFVRK